MANRSRLFDRDYAPAWLELGWFVGRHDPYQDTVCVYCGEQYTDREHVFPYVWLERFVNPADIGPKNFWTWIVPSCRECNGSASGTVFSTPQAKCDFIKAKMLQRHSKAIKSLEWTPEELRQMGAKMRSYIRGQQAKAGTIRNRLEYVGKLPETIGSPELVKYVSKLVADGEARLRSNGELLDVT